MGTSKHIDNTNSSLKSLSRKSRFTENSSRKLPIMMRVLMTRHLSGQFGTIGFGDCKHVKMFTRCNSHTENENTTIATDKMNRTTCVNSVIGSANDARTTVVPVKTKPAINAHMLSKLLMKERLLSWLYSMGFSSLISSPL